jgi:hypothetical protein
VKNGCVCLHATDRNESEEEWLRSGNEKRGKTRATSLQAKELEALFGLLSLFLSHPYTYFFYLFLSLWFRWLVG